MTSPVLSVSEILNFKYNNFFFFLNILNITITFHWVIAGSQRESRSSVAEAHISWF